MAATYIKDVDVAMKIINKHPIDNIFLGSDCPWESPDMSIKFVDSLPLTDDIKEKIFCKNAAAFFNIK